MCDDIHPAGQQGNVDDDVDRRRGKQWIKGKYFDFRAVSVAEKGENGDLDGDKSNLSRNIFRLRSARQSDKLVKGDRIGGKSDDRQ